MKITDEMVQVGLAAYYEADGLHIYDTVQSIITAALPHLQPVDVAAVTRPVANIESRTPKEVFDIMCDRIRALSAEPAQKGD